ncbi:MAG: hypothetical protein O9341_16625, partial [Paucibacter sp.]|nr:hypothetical protein [Roseateles sp.]
CRYLVEGFDDQQCAALVSRRPVYLIESDRHAAEEALRPILNKVPLQVEVGQGLRLDIEHIDHLGENCINFLNALEVPLEAWWNHIADREIIERQLDYVVKKAVGKRGFTALEGFRNALRSKDNGRDKYPATREFVRYLNDRDAQRTTAAQGPTGTV